MDHLHSPDVQNPSPRSKVMEFFLFAALFVGIVLLQVWLLPKMGVRT